MKEEAEGSLKSRIDDEDGRVKPCKGTESESAHQAEERRME